ncbi:DNA repair protein RecO [Weeksella sp. HMSC059D05]|uniref:DNA repair protein RecO n=1 Tax=Weeksella sp. HMSC059D05 TaxID=1715139 RepID=UPI0008A510CC|nr:DNA repair protein RecO [Weeksella sp. HMSC059D05]OFM82979.1 hypothetical protein HMPREF2660_02805 [Weeksella sp. HMSC059D05]
MDITTRGFVLSAVKYGDTRLILRIYTQEFGLRSFIVGNAFAKNKSAALYFPLASVEVFFRLKNNSTLVNAKQLSAANYFHTIHVNPVKSAMVMFLAEVMQMVLKEEESNTLLYRYLEENLIRFDEREKNYADFHLWFLMQLTKFLGFFPNIDAMEQDYFDLENGVFTSESVHVEHLTQTQTQLWKALLQLDFREKQSSAFNQSQRRELLHLLMKYYQIHLPNFFQPKSLEVLQEIFS